VPDRAAKSLGHEETFSKDLYDPDELQRRAARMCEAVATLLLGAESAGRTVTVKVRFADFSLVTRSHTVAVGLNAAPAIQAVAASLLGSVDPSPGVRLLGISVTGLQADDLARQLTFDLTGGGAGHQGDVGTGGAMAAEPAGASEAGARAAHLQEQWSDVATALSGIRDRFGAGAVGPAALVGEDGLEIPRRGAAQWGPAAEPGEP
jgi:DNA polymerase IV